MTRLLSPLAPKDTFVILTFHRVLQEQDPFRAGEPDVAGFERQIRMLRKSCHCMSLRDAVQTLRAGESLPRATAVITFDDGYLDNLTLAAPVLEKHGVPATVFVATGMLEQGIMWNDALIEAYRTARIDVLETSVNGLEYRFELSTLEQRIQACSNTITAVKHLPPDVRQQTVNTIVKSLGDQPAPRLMLQLDELPALITSGLEVGGHTVNHPILTSLPPAAAEQEIRDCKRIIEQSIQGTVDTFAYPNGQYGKDFSDQHMDMVAAAGYQAAVTTEWGAARAGANLFALPRCGLWHQRNPKAFLRMAANFRT